MSFGSDIVETSSEAWQPAEEYVCPSITARLKIALTNRTTCSNQNAPYHDHIIARLLAGLGVGRSLDSSPLRRFLDRNDRLDEFRTIGPYNGVGMLGSLLVDHHFRLLPPEVLAEIFPPPDEETVAARHGRMRTWPMSKRDDEHYRKMHPELDEAAHHNGLVL
jgi:hypothetical protein